MNLSNALTIVQAFEALLTSQAHAFSTPQLSELEALVANNPELNPLAEALISWLQKDRVIEAKVLDLINCPDLDRGLGEINPILKPEDLKNSQAALANAVRMAAASSAKLQPQQHS